MAKFRNRREQLQAIAESREFHHKGLEANGFFSLIHKKFLSYDRVKMGAELRMNAVDSYSPSIRELIHEFGLATVEKVIDAAETAQRLKALKKKFPKASPEKLKAFAIKSELEEQAIAKQFEKTG